MKFKRQKDIPMTTSYPPPVVTNEPIGGRGTPLPPVSENGSPSDSRNSPTYTRPPPALSVPQFSFSNMSSTHSATAPSSPPASTTPPLAGSTKIDMERIMKQDEAAMNDFIPPRQAMNSDDSDFDWDGDINLDANGQVTKKKGKAKPSNWKKLSPFLRMVIMILIGCPIVALPAILVTHLMADDPPLPQLSDPAPHPSVPKTTITLIFVWLSFMWGIVFLTNWGIDIVPVVVVRLSSIMSSSRLENVKSRMLIFVATKKYLKFLLASCWSIGSFAFLSGTIYWRADEKLNPVFTEVLGTIVAICALVFIEKILLQMISTNFHQTAYADRISENKYALSVLDRLSTSKKNVKKVRPTHSRHNTDTGDFFPSSANRSTLPSRSNSLEACGTTNHGVSVPVQIPGTNMAGGPGLEAEAEILSDGDAPIRLSETMAMPSTPMVTPTEANSRNSTLFSTERHRHHNQRGQKPRPNENIFRGINRRLYGIAMANKSAPSKDIGSTANAKRLAKTLFYNLQTNSDELVVQDFYPYFDSHEEAQLAFGLFDKDGNGDISKSEMKEKIFYVYKERKDLHTSLRDLSQAVGKLDIIFLTVVAVIWLFIVLSIFGKDIVKNMLSIGSFLVALSFVFGNSLKILFENIVFLFVTHPYDSGDLVCIDDTDMYVREVGLNSTTFVTWDGKRMYYPNNIISQKPIHNVRRSPNMTDKIVLHIDCYTPQSKIFELRARMRDYILKESKEFLPGLEIQIQEMDARLKISMCIEHKGNWQDSGRRWARRTAFNYALKEAVEDIGIKYYAVPQRVEVFNRENQEIDRYHNRRDDQDTLAPNSPLRQYSPEHVARLYRRPTINRPAEGGGEGGGGGE